MTKIKKINIQSHNKISKIDIENITTLKKEFKLKNISSIRIKKGDYEIEISSANLNSQSISIPKISGIDSEIPKQKNLKNINKNKNVVKSPMVGVAYLSAEPSSPPYIKIGQHVKQGDTLLLIEAMKTFNEVKAPISGIVKEIVILDNQPIEFGDELIIFE